MKLIPLTLLFIGSVSVAQAQSLTIEFESPEDFRDFRLGSMSEERTARVFEREVMRSLDGSVERIVADGHLHLTFTDIDLAGDIQPWRSRTGQDIRYVENIYPPRMEFRYVVMDAEGAVILEGETSQRDMAFMYRMGVGRSSNSFFFETELLRDWLRRDLPRKLASDD